MAITIIYERTIQPLAINIYIYNYLTILVRENKIIIFKNYYFIKLMLILPEK
jgi:hypothetical protein